VQPTFVSVVPLFLHSSQMGGTVDLPAPATSLLAHAARDFRNSHKLAARQQKSWYNM